MPSVGDISVRLTALTAEFKKDMREAINVTASWKDTASAVASTAGAAFAGLSAIIAKTTDAAGESARAGKELALAFRATGQAANLEGLKQMASDLQKTTNFEDDATVKSMAMLASFRLNEEQIKLLIPRIQDVSEFMGVDLATAARMVGTSVTTGTNSLQRMGVAMNDAQQASFAAATQTERVAMMADLMRQKLGGAARELASPFSQLKNAVGDLEEEIGFLVRDQVRAGAAALRDVVSGLAEHIAAMDPETKKTAGSLLLFAQGATGVAAALSGFALLLPSIAKGFVMMAPALGVVAAAAAAIVGVIGLVGAVKIAWDGNLGGMRDTLVSWADSIKAVFAKVGDFLNQYIVKPFIYASAYVSGQSRAMADETWKTYQSSNTGVDTSGLGAVAGAVGDVMKNVVDALKQSMGAGIDAFSGLFAGLVPKFATAPAGGGGGAGDTGGGSSGVDWKIRSEADWFIRGVRGGVDEFTNQIGEGMDAVSMPFQRIKQIADDVFTDVQMSLLDAGGAMIDEVTGGVNAFGAAFNWAVESNKPRLAEIIEAAAGAAKKFFEYAPTFKTNMRDAVLANAGTAGEMGQAALQNAGGGPFAMAGAALLTLVMKSKAFASVVGQLNTGLGVVADFLGKMTLLDSLKGVNAITNQMATLLMDFVGPALDALNNAIGTVLFTAVKWVSLIILSFVRGISEVWNGIVWVVQKILRGIGGIKLPDWMGGGHPFGKLNDWADSMDKAKINTDKLAEAMDKLKGMSYDEATATADATDAQTAQAEAMQEILNAPSGYKLDLTRFEAAQGDAYRGGGAAVATQTTPLVDNSIVIENLNVTADNPADAANRIIEVLERRTYVRTGSTSGVGLPYATPAIP